MGMKRIEIEPTRSYNEGPVKGRIHTFDWATAPDWSLVKISEVQVLTGLSRTALGERLKAGTFPSPSHHGKDRCWSLGAIRRWCQSVTAEADKELADE